MHYNIGEREGCTCQDRVAELQAELQRAPNAVLIGKRAWALVASSAEKRAREAVRRIAAHVLGEDDITGVTRERAQRVTTGIPRETPFCSESTTETQEDEMIARRFRFWLCEDLDDDFARFFRELPQEKRAPVARLAARSPRVWLGLAPKVAALVSPEVGPPRREAGTLFPTRVAHTETHPEESYSPAGVRRASTTETCSSDEEPARDIAQVPVPVFDIAEVPVFSALSYEPSFTVELQRPQEKISLAPDARTRGEVAKMLCEALTCAPQVPRGAFPVWAVLTTLAEEQRRVTRKEQQGDAETPFEKKLRELQEAFSLDAELLPVPTVVYTAPPPTDWVFALEALAEACTPELRLSLQSFRVLLPDRTAPCTESSHSYTTEQRAALTTAWPLFERFLEEIDVHATLEEILSDADISGSFCTETQLRTYNSTGSFCRETPQNPLRASMALQRWHVLVTEILPSADDSIPAVIETLERLTAKHPEARDALRWSAEVSAWAGLPACQRPDGMWCAYRKIQLRLSKLEMLPMQITREHPRETQEKSE